MIMPIITTKITITTLNLSDGKVDVKTEGRSQSSSATATASSFSTDMKKNEDKVRN
jgi:hypothetical protein